MMLLPILLAAIQLTGVTGDHLRARAFFDANNVKVGDPLILTVDFLGSADFASLHPPALSRSVSRSDWKLDDASAKTDTFRDARRLTYRIRPMREGVLWFPELEFEYEGSDGAKRLVRSNAIPVHAKPGTDVVVAGMSDSEEDAMPEPDALITTPPDGLSEDDLFAWRKACARPTADAFAEFDFTEAKLNEARCSILEGDWRRAISVYSRLEWKIGQTPEIERGLLAALARKFQNPAVELPVWRQIGRPVLRHGWKGRVSLVFGGAAAFLVVFWLLGRIIRMLACVAIVVTFALPAFAQMRDPFAEIEEMHRQMREQMHQMMSMPAGGGFNISFGGASQPAADIKAVVEIDRPELQVGDTFKFILSIETQKGVTVGQIQMTPSEVFGMQQVGNIENLADGSSSNPSNIVKRLAVPVRYDVPFKGKMTFDVQGMATVRQTMNGGRMSFTSSTSFAVRSAPIEIEVKPLPTDNQPDGFSGIIADKVEFSESIDLGSVETNDIVTITYRMAQNGYMPDGWMPEGAAFEWSRGEWRRYLVADGVGETPKVEVVYYDPKAKVYRTVSAGQTHISYR
jgi:hypothetical protein